MFACNTRSCAHNNSQITYRLTFFRKGHFKVFYYFQRKVKIDFNQDQKGLERPILQINQKTNAVYVTSEPQTKNFRDF